ncbi:hypothetical protein TIFTF001_023269 [Ficus carica]|uniref:Retrotransposon gag domain-containing protein n=1 Tax=Ficus carica TaxID=3494 RepID=A0AA88AJ93_FICCA|nr:hypothetical protein TIFTF001_023269 [Ficus carica]
MVCPRVAAVRRPQNANLAKMVVNLQHRLEDQEREMQNLREQLAQRNQELPPPPVVPTQPVAPAVPAAQAAQPVILQELLYERFRLLNFMDLMDQEKMFFASYVMKKDARYWWETLQMRRNVLEMTWNDFIQEFNDKFYNQMAMKAQQNEFNNTKQGTMSVTEAVCKFDHLARLCPHLVPTEDERVRALCAEYRLAQAKQERAKFFKEKKKEKSQSK